MQQISLCLSWDLSQQHLASLNSHQSCLIMVDTFRADPHSFSIVDFGVAIQDDVLLNAYSTRANLLPHC